MKKCKIILACLVLVFLLTSCGTNNSVISAIHNGDAKKACEIYNKRISGNSQKEEALINVINNEMDAYISKYNNGDVTIDEVKELFVVMEDCSFIDYGIIAYSYEELYALQQSKDAYSEAKKYEKDKKYAEAIHSYLLVENADINYSAAQEKSEELKAMLSDSVIESADKLANDGDYASAINSINEALLIAEDTSLSEKRDEYIEKFNSQTIENAKKDFSEKKDYQSAISLIKTAMESIEDLTTGDYEVLYDEIDKYLEYEPDSLIDLEYTKIARYIVVSDADGNDGTDVNKKAYEGKIIKPCGGSLNSETADGEDEACVTYYLNAEYRKFTGTLYRPYSTLSCDYDWKENGIMKVYGDGVLLYTSPKFTQKTYKTVNFNINVSGVRELKIVMLGVWTDTDTGWIGMNERYPKICAANLYVGK